MMQIRKAMKEADQHELLTGVIEIDEHLVGLIDCLKAIQTDALQPPADHQSEHVR